AGKGSRRPASLAGDPKSTEHRQHERKKACRGHTGERRRSAQRREGIATGLAMSGALTGADSMKSGERNMKSETRRPGDEPQFDEHAKEDSYFAEKEHELVEDMKFEFTKARAAQT